jgi:hypothetical protein
VEAGDKAKASWVGTYAKNAPHNDNVGAPNNVRAPGGTNYAIAGGFGVHARKVCTRFADSHMHCLALATCSCVAVHGVDE